MVLHACTIAQVAFLPGSPSHPLVDSCSSLISCFMRFFLIAWTEVITPAPFANAESGTYYASASALSALQCDDEGEFGFHFSVPPGREHHRASINA